MFVNKHIHEYTQQRKYKVKSSSSVQCRLQIISIFVTTYTNKDYANRLQIIFIFLTIYIQIRIARTGCFSMYMSSRASPLISLTAKQRY